MNNSSIKDFPKGAVAGFLKEFLRLFFKNLCKILKKYNKKKSESSEDFLKDSPEVLFLNASLKDLP